MDFLAIVVRKSDACTRTGFRVTGILMAWRVPVVCQLEGLVPLVSHWILAPEEETGLSPTSLARTNCGVNSISV